MKNSKPKKRILMIGRDMRKADAMDLRFLKIAEFLSSNYDVTVVLPTKYNIKNCRVITLDIPSRNSFKQRLSFSYYLRKRISMLSNLKPDIVYTQDCMNAFVFKHIKSFRIYDIVGMSRTETIVGSNSIKNLLKARLLERMEKSGFQNADLILTVNEAHKKEISKLTDTQIIVFRDAVENYFLKAKLKRHKGFRAYFVGSLIKKRIESLIKAMPKILDTKFVIIGDGPDMNSYALLANKLGIDIVFKGYITHDKIADQLEYADVCFSDDWSTIGFPTKVFEYMALGIPTMVEDTPAVREIIRNGENGLLYRNPEDFVQKMAMLQSDTAKRQMLGRKAKEFIQKKHTWDIRKLQLNRIISRVLK